MDKSYWNKYYSKKLGVQEPSSFAVYVLKMMSDGDSILELGCAGMDGIPFSLQSTEFRYLPWINLKL